MKKLGSLCLITYIFFASTSSATLAPYIDGTIQGGNKRNYGQISGFVPLYYTGENLIFTDLRFMHHLPGSKETRRRAAQTWEGNIGIGARWLRDGDSVIGFATYFDHRVTDVSGKKGFNQVTLNAHFLTPMFHNNLNLYLPVGKKLYKKQGNKSFTGNAKTNGINLAFLYSNNFTEEQALQGADFRFNSAIPAIEQLRLGGLVYGFKNKKPGKNIIGAGFTGEYTLNDSLKFEGRFTYDKVNKSSILAGIRYILDFNTHKKSATDKLFTAKVDRDLDIITNQNKNYAITEEDQPNIKVIRTNTLKDVDNKDNFKQNVNDITTLSNALSNNNVMLILTDQEIFSYDQVNKVSIQEISDLKTQYKNESLNKLNEGQTVAQINTVNAQLAPISRSIAVVATQQAYQQTTNSNSYMIAGNVVSSNYANLVAELFNKYAKSTSTPHKSFIVNLPGYNNAEIERAGLMLMTKENVNGYVILGTDANSAAVSNDPWHAWLSGQSEQKDNNFQDTIIREAFEESGGLLALTPQDVNDAIAQGRFIYSPQHKILTIIQPDIYNIAPNLNSNLNIVKSDPSLSSAMKEMAGYKYVNINEINSLRVRMANTTSNNPRDPVYYINAKDDSIIRIEHYAKSLNTSGLVGAFVKAGRMIP